MKYYIAKTKDDFIFIASLFNSKNNKYLINKKKVEYKDLIKWNESPKKNYYIIIEKNKKIGWFAIDILDNPKEGKIGMIIDKPYQGRGFGFKTMRHIEEEAKKLKIKKLKLQVFEKNLPAISIYKKSGFKETNRLIEMEKEI